MNGRCRICGWEWVPNGPGVPDCGCTLDTETNYTADWARRTRLPTNVEWNTAALVFAAILVVLIVIGMVNS